MCVCVFVNLSYVVCMWLQSVTSINYAVVIDINTLRTGDLNCLNACSRGF